MIGLNLLLKKNDLLDLLRRWCSCPSSINSSNAFSCSGVGFHLELTTTGGGLNSLYPWSTIDANNKTKKLTFIHVHIYTHIHTMFSFTCIETTSTWKHNQRNREGKMKRAYIPRLWYCEKKSLPWWMQAKHGELVFEVLLGEVTVIFLFLPPQEIK